MVATLDSRTLRPGRRGTQRCHGPELGINVVDLGLIYDLALGRRKQRAHHLMTLTSAGCPLTDVLEEQTAEALDGIVDAFRINWVWMPPWGPEKITDDGRDMMRALGFASLAI